MPSRTDMSRRNFLMSTGGAAVWAGSTRGYSAAEMRAKAEDGTLTGVSKWELDTPALCVDLDAFERNIATMRTQADGDARRQPAAWQVAQVPDHREAAARRRLDRHLRRQDQRGRSLLGQRHRADPDDDVERDGEQDPARHGDPQDEPSVHPGGRLPAERARPQRRGEGSRRRRRRRRRRGDRHAQRHSGRRSGARARAARRHAAEPEAARHHQLRRRRPAHQGLQEPPGSDAQAIRAVARHLRTVQARGAEHRDFQRRRHRHLQHPAEGLLERHRRPGGQLHLHGLPVSRDRRRIERRGLHRLRARR